MKRIIFGIIIGIGSVVLGYYCRHLPTEDNLVLACLPLYSCSGILIALGLHSIINQQKKPRVNDRG